MSKERPIIFSPEMVEAIIAGRKTQTRRPLKRQSLPGAPKRFQAYEFEMVSPRGKVSTKFGFQGGEDCIQEACPYGQPGDLLWVRETFSWSRLGTIIYKALFKGSSFPTIKWKPSIHMRREDSRITLKVEDVWVHRIQDIRSHEAKAEGVLPSPTQNYVDAFEELWNSIYNNWNDNPWVWAITFSVVEVKQ